MCFEADILTAQTSDTSRLFRTFFYCKSVMCICPNNLNTVARTWIQAAVSSIGDHAPRKSHSCVLQFGYISATKYPPKFPQNLFERKLYLTLLPGAATMTRTPHFFWLVVELPLTPMPVVGFEGAAWGLGVEGLLPPALLVCCQYVSTDVSTTASKTTNLDGGGRWRAWNLNRGSRDLPGRSASGTRGHGRSKFTLGRHVDDGFGWCLKGEVVMSVVLLRFSCSHFIRKIASLAASIDVGRFRLPRHPCALRDTHLRFSWCDQLPRARSVGSSLSQMDRVCIRYS